MIAVIILRDLLLWIYLDAPVNFLRIWANFTWFFYHFFSIRILLMTLFSKWKQIGEPRGKHGFFEKYVATFVINSLMRIIGFMVRSIFIIAGVITILLEIILGAAIFILWFILPILIVAILFVGVRFLFI